MFRGKITALFVVSYLAVGCGDSTPPEIRLVSPAANAGVSGQVKILVEVLGESKPVQFTLFVNGERYSNQSASNSAVFIWDTDTIRNHTGHVIQIAATDHAGNSAMSDSITLIVRHNPKSTSGYYGFGITMTSEGDLGVVGYTKLAGAGKHDHSLWLLKIDGGGELLWDRVFDHARTDRGFGIDNTADGGFIVTGMTRNRGIDLWLIRTDGDGNELWEVKFGGDGREVGASVKQTADGGFIVTGYTTSQGAGRDDLWLLRTDGMGDLIWESVFGGPGWDRGESVIEVDDGYIVAGYKTNPETSMDAWLIKTDRKGNLIWERNYGGAKVDQAAAVIQTGDGGFMIAGQLRSKDKGMTDLWLIKTDSDGFIQWDKTYGGDKMDIGLDVSELVDGGYIATGYSYSMGAGSSDAYILRIDEDGDVIWEKSIGGSDTDWGIDILQAPDGSFYLTGYTKMYRDNLSDLWIIQLAADGAELWKKPFWIVD